MPTINLSNITKPQELISPNPNIPLSFLDWRNINVGISYDDAQIQYKRYLTTFFVEKTNSDSIVANQLKQDYINLIKRLQIIFSNDEEFARYKNIDLSSETDLKIAIPAYAKKLKEIALFYNRKREELKRKKLEFSLVGSDQGLLTLLENKLLTEFTRNDQTNFVSINPLVSRSPYLSAIIGDFKIEVEEYYNTQDQFIDANQLNPFQCLFNNICDSVLTPPLSSQIDPLNEIFECEVDSNTTDTFLQQLYYKYLGVDVGYVSGGYYTELYRNIQLQLDQGNNYFYWFSGSTIFDAPEGLYKDISINDIDWSSATGSDSVSGADIIFVTAGRNYAEAAWLKSIEYITVTDTMKAELRDGTIFKYPYCNYGTSAVGGSWSGPLIDSTIIADKKFFPTEEDFNNSQKNITKEYWTDFSLLSSVEPINIQNTTLGRVAGSSKNYKNADKIKIYSSRDSTKFTGDSTIGWLYKMNQAELPITEGTNNIYFPYFRYSTADEVFFTSTENQHIPLSTLDTPYSFNGAIASLDISTSDKIFKLNSICGPQIECAWLKSNPLKSLNPELDACTCVETENVFSTKWEYISGGMQASLNIKCEPNNMVRFVWSGDTVDINSVPAFIGVSHDTQCPYHNLNFSKKVTESDRDSLVAERWKKCTCQAVQYSPFGRDVSFTSPTNIPTDFIVRDTGFPTAFNKKTWIGRDGNPITTSEDAATFSLDTIEGDLGWGNGQWTNGSGNKSFILEKGQTYIYYRGISNNCQYESPFLIINQPYDSFKVISDNCEKVNFAPVWMKAVQDLSGNWIDGGVISDMTLSFGDYLTYEHLDAQSIKWQKLLYAGNEIDAVSGNSIILNSDDENISFMEAEYTIPSTNFLIKIPLLSAVNYWAVGSDSNDSSTLNKTLLSNGQTYRIVDDYIPLTQPDVANINLTDMNILQFEKGNCSSECVLWEQPLNFNVYSPIRQWNKLTINSCIENELLNRLNKQIYDCVQKQQVCFTECSIPTICDCDNFCYINKVGSVPTDQKSNIVLNTELSGIPLYINYFARSGFVLSATTQDITHGERSLFVPELTGDFPNTGTPWTNLLNQEGSTFTNSETMNNRFTRKDLGPYFPTNIVQSRYETHNDAYTVSGSSGDLKYFRKNNYFDSPFNKKTTDSSIFTIVDWSTLNGVVSTGNHQTFHPYESLTKDIIVRTEPVVFSPWNVEGRWIGGDEFINFRGQYNVYSDNGWYSEQPTISAINSWENDIYGNSYFHASGSNDIYMKMLNGELVLWRNAMSSVINKYNNI